MAKIFWDTNLFIYLFERNPAWLPRVIELREKMKARRDQLLTSWLTVGEVLTKPKECDNEALGRSYLKFFLGGSVQVIPFDFKAAQCYADIRSRLQVNPADAIQLACAAAAGTDLFVTNDSRLSRVVVPGITFVTSVDKVPL